MRICRCGDNPDQWNNVMAKEYTVVIYIKVCDLVIDIGDDAIRGESLTVREWKDPRTTKPHIIPIYATSSFEFEDIQQGMRIFNQEKQGHTYGRYGNPTVEATASKIAALETFNTDLEASAVMTNSGMAAVHVLVAGLLKKRKVLLAFQSVALTSAPLIPSTG